MARYSAIDLALLLIGLDGRGLVSALLCDDRCLLSLPIRNCLDVPADRSAFGAGEINPVLTRDKLSLCLQLPQSCGAKA